MQQPAFASKNFLFTPFPTLWSFQHYMKSFDWIHKPA